MIQISISPNLEKDDLRKAISIIASPVNWFNFRYTELLEEKIEKYYGGGYKSIAFNSGRSAMLVLLRALGIGSGDEVLVQPFTCAAAVNPIIWSGAIPVYVDVDNSFNIDPAELAKNITPLTKAVVVQHTFGIPAQMDEIVKICNKHKLILIEDCALSFGAKYKNKKIGSFGTASFLSFGRDKTISSVFGGSIVSKNKKIIEKSLEIRKDLDYPSFVWTFKQLMHPILTSFALFFYQLGIGKYTIGKGMMFVFNKLKLIDRPIYKEEYYAQKPDIFPKKMPGGLSYLALNQIGKIDRFNSHRKNIGNIYIKLLKNTKFKLPPIINGAVYLRFPVLIDKAAEIVERAKKDGVILGDWYRQPIYPIKRLSDFYYKRGSCPKSEYFCSRIINLPTNIKINTQATKILTDKMKIWIKK